MENIMTPRRQEVINGKKIKEYYWAGDLVVYVDHHAVDSSFEKTCEDIREDKEIQWTKR